MSLTPKNWDSFQHYKDRSPAWIKLHRGLLDDYDFNRLPLASRALAPMLWLLASEYEGGKITASIDALAFRLRISTEELREALKPLIDAGFFLAASDLLAPCERAASPEREEEEQEREEERRIKRAERASDWPSDFFEKFWEQYPRHEEKKKTKTILDRLRKSGNLPWAVLYGGVMKYAAACIDRDPKYIKQPPTWLNAGCWDDEIRASNGTGHGKQNLIDLADQLTDELRQRETAAGIG